MKIVRYTLLALLFVTMNAMAVPASEGTIKELLTITQAQKLVEGMRAQMDSWMENSMQQALNGQTPSAKQKQAMTKMRKRMTALLQGELAWEKLEPMYVRLYQESFSEEEVAGMLTFYKSPAGQAVIYKMPVLMQKTMLEMQKMTSSMTPKMQKIQEEFVADMKAAQ